jgi:Holliday junction resolvase
MANKNKNKGKTFERQMCGILTNSLGLNFQRVPNSGSFVGGKNSNRYDVLTEEQKLLADGDIIVPPELSHISLECKSYKDFSFNSLFIGKNALLDGWIKQSSDTKKQKWLLFFKINNKGIFVVYDISKFQSYMQKENYHIYKNQYVIQDVFEFLEKNKNKLYEK